MLKKNLIPILISFLLLVLCFLTVYFLFLKPKTDNRTLVLGATDITKLNAKDEEYYKNATIFTNTKWIPKEYVKMERVIDTPTYNINIGSITKDQWKIGVDDFLYLECNQIDGDSLSIPPYWPSCELKVNDFVIADNIRSEVMCEWDSDYKNPTECKQEVEIVMYQDEHLKSKYLFFSTLDTVGSVYSIWGYELGEKSYTPLYFDLKDSISQYKLTRGGLYTDNLYLAFTDNSKTDFRLITSFYDPSMQSIKALYYEWQVTNGRLLLKNKVVEM